MGKKLTIRQVKSKVSSVHGDTLVLDESTYKNTYTKCRFIDKDFGEWWVTPRSIWGLKQGHPGRRYEKARKALRLPIEEIKQRIYSIHGDLVYIDESTYVNTKKKVKLIDREYGAWWAKLNDVFSYNQSHPARKQQKIQQTFLQTYGVKHVLQNKDILEKQQQTCLRKYGTINAMQNKDIALKSAKNSNNSFILYHWCTKEEIVCRGTWERKVVEYFNKNKINFVWQIAFNMPNGKIYIVDTYLPEEDIYIEVKGYFRKDAQEKWDWFRQEHPNSELWNQEKLKALKII